MEKMTLAEHFIGKGSYERFLEDAATAIKKIKPDFSEERDSLLIEAYLVGHAKCKLDYEKEDFENVKQEIIRRLGSASFHEY